ncbi:unnamed protein product, partial [Prorocentrum cordatum]
VIIEEGIKVVETAGRNPGEHVAKFKEAGIKEGIATFLHRSRSPSTESSHQGDPQVHRHQTCDICREVRRGHDQHRRLRVWGPPWGRRRAFAVWVLLPKAVKSLRVPVIVSGACANGQQLAGALAMGAAGE